MYGVAGLTIGLEVSENIILFGSTLVYGFHTGIGSPVESNPFGSPAFIKLDQ